MVSLSVLIFTNTHHPLHTGFTLPFLPLLPIISIGSSFFLILNLPATTSLYFPISLLIAVLIYPAYS
ncbi:amino acid permease C-terminal domain-containing protein, partial [Bacillus sp. WP8]|uniref:amino acid permease C-terminal domain-containing protein n=1 Tax=Bacillus sp. WP8 TaxID=756828 RepID=UPI0028CB39BF